MFRHCAIVWPIYSSLSLIEAAGCSRLCLALGHNWSEHTERWEFESEKAIQIIYMSRLTTGPPERVEHLNQQQTCVWTCAYFFFLLCALSSILKLLIICSVQFDTYDEYVSVAVLTADADHWGDRVRNKNAAVSGISEPTWSHFAGTHVMWLATAPHTIGTHLRHERTSTNNNRTRLIRIHLKRTQRIKLNLIELSNMPLHAMLSTFVNVWIDGASATPIFSHFHG